MSDLIRYDNDGLELVINQNTGESFTTQAGYARMSGLSKQAISKRVLQGVNQNEVKTAEILTSGGLQGVNLIPASLAFKWLMKDNPELAFKMGECGATVYFHQLAGYKVESNLKEVQPIQLPPQDIRIHQLRTDIEFFGQFGIDLTNPRYSQYVKDIVVNTIIGVASLPEVKEVWLGVAEKAESMGYPANIILKYRSSLGKFVKLNIENYQLESVKEERICNGRNVKILLYKDCDSLTGLVRDFMSQRVR